MIKANKLIKKFYSYFPYHLQDIWDHSGFQAGVLSSSREIEEVILCLDYTEDVEKVMLSHPHALVLSHHPFFFGKKNDVLLKDPKKQILLENLLKNDILLYSFHTNFDKGEGGMNDTFFSLLSMNPFVLDDPTYRYADVEKPISLFELLSKIQSVFSLPYIQYLKGEKEEIQRIAVVLGGGGNMSRTAFEHGADVYISGDMAHHSRLDITRYGLNYIDLPHECEEKCFIEGMSRILRQIDSNLTLIPVYCQHYFSCYGGNEHA